MDAFPTELLNRQKQMQWRRPGAVVGGSPSLGGIPAPRSDWGAGGYWIAEFQCKLNPELALSWEKFLNQMGNGVAEFVLPRIIPAYTHLAGGTFSLSSASLGATQITISNGQGKVLKGGESFTIVHPTAGPRLYSLGTVSAPSGGAQVCKFLPRLREAVSNGAAADFVNPRCAVRVETDPAALWPVITPPYTGTPSIKAVESFKWLESVV